MILTLGVISSVCKAVAKTGCIGTHFWFCKIHPDFTYLKGKECASCKNVRLAEVRRAKEAAEAEAKNGKKKKKCEPLSLSRFSGF
jgi:hypothetical protein